MKLLDKVILVCVLLALLFASVWSIFNPLHKPDYVVSLSAISYLCMELYACDCSNTGLVDLRGSVVVYGLRSIDIRDEHFMSIREACYSIDECVCPIKEGYNE